MWENPLSISSSPVKTAAPVQTKWYWPELVDLASARQAVHRARGAALFVAGMTVLVALLALAGIELMKGASAWALLDAALFFLIAWGLHRFSRTAAVAGLVLFVLERLAVMFQTRASGILLTVILILLFVHGVRGAFAYHRLRTEIDPAAAAQMFD